MSSSDYWDAHKRARLTDLQYDTITAAGPRDQQRAGLLSQLEDDCDALEALAYEMRRRRNACAPVSALPPEIFIRIFSIVADLEPPRWSISVSSRKTSLVGKRVSIGWTPILQVCKRWRELGRGAGEIWGQSSGAGPAPKSVTFNTKSSKIMRAPVPSLLPALHSINLSGISGLSMLETLDILTRTPLLRVLELDNCHWSTFDISLVNDRKIILPRLEDLALVDIVGGDENGYNCMPLELLLGCLQFPHGTILELVPYLRRAEDTIRLLRRLLTRIVSHIYMPKSTLCVGLEDRLMSTRILLTEIPTFGETDVFTETKLGCLNFWRASIGFDVLYLEQILCDAEISTLMQGIQMLSITTNSFIGFTISQIDYAAIENALFRVFLSIRILHVAHIPDTGSCEAAWRFLDKLADVSSVALRYPCLEEIRLSPSSNSPVSIGSPVVRSITDILKKRAGHHYNRVHTVQLGLARPSADSEEGLAARELESLLPTVVWGTASSNGP